MNKCPNCGEHHDAIHEADHNDPRIEPWRDLLTASGMHQDGDHLLMINLGTHGGGKSSEVLVTGMDDPVAQVEILSRIVATILADSGAEQDAKIMRHIARRWLDAMESIRDTMNLN